MNTIYIPQRIETTEQAAALPNGTIAIEPDTEADQFSLMRATYDGLDCWITDKKIYTIDFPVGWTALVPIEAEEEVVWHDKWDDAYQRTAEKDAARLAAHPIGADVRRIFITPWEAS